MWGTYATLEAPQSVTQMRRHGFSKIKKLNALPIIFYFLSPPLLPFTKTTWFGTFYWNASQTNNQFLGKPNLVTFFIDLERFSFYIYLFKWKRVNWIDCILYSYNSWFAHLATWPLFQQHFLSRDQMSASWVATVYSVFILSFFARNLIVWSGIVCGLMEVHKWLECTSLGREKRTTGCFNFNHAQQAE